MAWLGENTGYVRHHNICLKVLRVLSTLPCYIPYICTHSILLSKASCILMYGPVINSVKKWSSPFCSSSCATSKLLLMVAKCSGLYSYSLVTLREAPTKRNKEQTKLRANTVKWKVKYFTNTPNTTSSIYV